MKRNHRIKAGQSGNSMRKPRYRQAGNSALLIELGDEPSLELSFYVMALGQHILQQADPRFFGYGTCATTILIEYDPQKISSSKVMECCDGWITSLPPYDQFKVSSRLIEIPVCYNDRWTRECAEEYRIQPNFDFLVKANDCANAGDLIRRHSSHLWWVAGVDFPGSPFLKQLGAPNRFKAPRYKDPRMRTPAGTVVLGDTFTMIYPTVTRDGHQMLGRTPISFYDPDIFSSPDFDHSMASLRTGDRVRFRPIDEDEFLTIEASVAANTYQLVIREKTEMTVADFHSGIANA
jgi:urea carboxylase